MNEWHDKLYSKDSAKMSINSPKFKKLAKDEVANIIQLTRLQEGEKILDVPCGTGRHMVEFAKKGFSVTGVDINKELLAIAQKSLKKFGRQISLKKGNINNLKQYYRKYDLVTCLFTSIGYFDTDAKNEAALKEMLKCLKPGGKLIVETISGGYLKQIWSPSSWHAKGSEIIAEVRNFDKKTKYNEGIQCFLNKKTGKVEAHYNRIRIYQGRELARIFKNLGAKSVKLYGNLKGDKYCSKSSNRIVLVASN